MVATVPGGPKTSMTTCFGLNGATSVPLPLGVDVTSCDAEMLLRRYTANPATAMTTTATSSIQRRLNAPRIDAPRIDNRGIRDLSTSGDIGRWEVSSTDGSISTRLTIRYGTGH